MGTAKILYSFQLPSMRAITSCQIRFDHNEILIATSAEEIIVYDMLRAQFTTLLDGCNGSKGSLNGMFVSSHASQFYTCGDDLVIREWSYNQNKCSRKKHIEIEELQSQSLGVSSL